MNKRGKEDKSKTALFLACEEDYPDVLESILLAGENDGVDDVNVNTTDEAGRTALNVASIKGHEMCVKRLLQNPSINVNIANRTDGMTALMSAAMFGHEGVVRMLLNHPNIKINKRSADNHLIEQNTALTLACREGFLGEIRLLLEYKAEHDVPGCVTTLWAACDAGRVDVLQFFMKEMPIVMTNFLNVAKTSNNMTGLVASCHRGHEEVSLMLLDQPEIDIREQCNNENGGKSLTALIAASTSGNRVIVEKLLDLNDREVDDEIRTSMLEAKDFKNRSALSSCMVAASRWSEKMALRALNFTGRDLTSGTTDREAIIQSIKQRLNTINPLKAKEMNEEAELLLISDKAERKAKNEKEREAQARLIKEEQEELSEQIDALAIHEDGEEDEEGKKGEVQVQETVIQ